MLEFTGPLRSRLASTILVGHRLNARDNENFIALLLKYHHQPTRRKLVHNYPAT